MAKTNKPIAFDTATASHELISAIEEAIKNMTQEIKKKPDQELSGSSRRAELLSYKETAIACKELIVERQKLIDMAKKYEDTGEIEDSKDFGSGFAEKYSKKV